MGVKDASHVTLAVIDHLTALVETHLTYLASHASLPLGHLVVPWVTSESRAASQPLLAFPSQS
jgi:hypothetical protein